MNHDKLIDEILDETFIMPREYMGGMDIDADGNLQVNTPDYDDEDEDIVEPNPWDIHYPTEEEIKEIARLEKVNPEKITYMDVCVYFVPVLEYDDTSGLEESEIDALEEWSHKYRYLWPLTCYNGENPEPSFGKCNICGLRANVVPILVVER